MGTRAEVEVQHGEGTIYLYQHYDGYEIAETVANALERSESRWNDEAYLTRIIFSEMIKDDINGTMGYGIMLGPADADKYRVKVNPHTQTVAYNNRVLTFAEFVDRYNTKALASDYTEE